VHRALKIIAETLKQDEARSERGERRIKNAADISSSEARRCDHFSSLDPTARD